jgi:hypothetical protein
MGPLIVQDVSVSLIWTRGPIERETAASDSLIQVDRSLAPPIAHLLEQLRSQPRCPTTKVFHRKPTSLPLMILGGTRSVATD